LAVLVEKKLHGRLISQEQPPNCGNRKSEADPQESSVKTSLGYSGAGFPLSTHPVIGGINDLGGA